MYLKLIKCLLVKLFYCFSMSKKKKNCKKVQNPIKEQLCPDPHKAKNSHVEKGKKSSFTWSASAVPTNHHNSEPKEIALTNNFPWGKKRMEHSPKVSGFSGCYLKGCFYLASPGAQREPAQLNVWRQLRNKGIGRCSLLQWSWLSKMWGNHTTLRHLHQEKRRRLKHVPNVLVSAHSPKDKGQAVYCGWYHFARLS